MPSTLKKVKVKVGDKIVEKQERFPVTFWIADGYDAVEPEPYCLPCLTQPARGALSTQEEQVPIKFTPSPALKALLLAEVKAAVDAQLAK